MAAMLAEYMPAKSPKKLILGATSSRSQYKKSVTSVIKEYYRIYLKSNYLCLINFLETGIATYESKKVYFII
jgi:hypothetical protein